MYVLLTITALVIFLRRLQHQLTDISGSFRDSVLAAAALRANDDMTLVVVRVVEDGEPSRAIRREDDS